MRFPHSPLPLLLGVLVVGCDPTATTQPDGFADARPFSSVAAAPSGCTLAIHAVLREAGSTAAVGQVQFRVDPPEPGSSDATVRYWGVYGPTGGPTFDVLSVSLVSRVPGQGPAWSDSEKGDPGTTLTAAIAFGRTAPMSQAMALALVDDPSGFKAVVNVVGTTGGREAEGSVEPRRDVPESLRERRRLCFGGG